MSVKWALTNKRICSLIPCDVLVYKIKYMWKKLACKDQVVL